MPAVLLVIHMFITVGLVAVILLQRSEGGALGMGGGPGGMVSGRAAGDMLTRATTWLATAFLVSSLLLVIVLNAGAGVEGSATDEVDTAPLDAPAFPDDDVTPGGVESFTLPDATPTTSTADESSFDLPVEDETPASDDTAEADDTNTGEDPADEGEDSQEDSENP